MDANRLAAEQAAMRARISGTGSAPGATQQREPSSVVGSPLLSQVLGLRGLKRTQSPALEQSDGRNPKWFIRPFVDVIAPDGTLQRVQKRIYLGDVATTGKRQALTARTEALGKINSSQYITQAQIPLSTILDLFLERVVDAGEVKSTTATKYRSLIRRHIRPDLGNRKLGELTTMLVEDWLKGKAASLSWYARSDLKNVLCTCFHHAIRFGFWRNANPILQVRVGRRTLKRTRQPITLEQTQALLAALPADLRLIVEMALYCTLRISEVLGLQWRDIDLERGTVTVNRRYSRGDVDTPKTQTSRRTIALGALAEDLRARERGGDSDWVFWFTLKDGKRSRSDCTIRLALTAAAKKLGLYYEGFGFHAFRREAITRLGNHASPFQVARMAGHSSPDMSLYYTNADHEAQAAAVSSILEQFGRAAAPVSDRMALLSDLVRRLNDLPEERLRQLVKDLEK